MRLNKDRGSLNPVNVAGRGPRGKKNRGGGEGTENGLRLINPAPIGALSRGRKSGTAPRGALVIYANAAGAGARGPVIIVFSRMWRHARTIHALSADYLFDRPPRGPCLRLRPTRKPATPDSQRAFSSDRMLMRLYATYHASIMLRSSLPPSILSPFSLFPFSTLFAFRLVQFVCTGLRGRGNWNVSLTGVGYRWSFAPRWFCFVRAMEIV